MTEKQQFDNAIKHLESIATVCDMKNEKEIAYLVRESIHELKLEHESHSNEKQKFDIKKALPIVLLFLKACVSDNDSTEN